VRGGHDPVLDPGLPRRGVAIACMFGAGLLFAVMSLCAKAAGTPLAGKPIPAAESTFFRFAFGTVVMLPFLRVRNARLLGEDKLGLTMRGLTGGAAVLCYFVALEQTTLTHAVLLNFTSIVFAPICAFVALRERIGPPTVIAIVLASVGIVLVTRPVGGGANLGDLAGLASGMLAGAAVTSIRHLRRGETASSIFFYFSLVGMPIAAVACLFQPLVWPTAAGWALLLGMAASSVTAQMLQTFGYGFVRTSEGVLMTLSQIVYSSLASSLLFREPLPMATIVGGGLILAAGIWSASTPKTPQGMARAVSNPSAGSGGPDRWSTR